jgi:hypothetical protein
MFVPWRKVILLNRLSAAGILKDRSQIHIRGEKGKNILNTLHINIQFYCYYIVRLRNHFLMVYFVAVRYDPEFK